MRAVRDARGVSLPEVVVVLTLMGVLVSLATPRMARFVRVTRVHGAAMLLRQDLSFARMLAVRSGHGAVVRFYPSPDCAWAGKRGGRAYRVVPRGPALPAPDASLRLLGPRVCFDLNNSDSLVYNSRGLLAPFNNRTIWVADDDVRDSLTLSVTGRIFWRQGPPPGMR
jgi:prepilin-type N-terminal cleavage/methylation domain-containing protein